MGLKEKAEKLKKKKKTIANAPSVSLKDDSSQEIEEKSSFGTLAALIIGAIGIILLKGRKS